MLINVFICKKNVFSIPKHKNDNPHKLLFVFICFYGIVECIFSLVFLSSITAAYSHSWVYLFLCMLVFGDKLMPITRVRNKLLHVQQQYTRLCMPYRHKHAYVSIHSNPHSNQFVVTSPICVCVLFCMHSTIPLYNTVKD